MLNKINHIAIAVPNLEEAKKKYKEAFNVKISEELVLPEHGVKTIFIQLLNANIELLEPFGKNSPIKKFIEKNPKGGIHHICYEVKNLSLVINDLQTKNIEILGNGIPRIGAHDKPVIFLHPKNFNGTLIELEEV